MPQEAGSIGEHGVILPLALPLTSERLERHGLFLIEDGQTIFLWVGRDAVPQLVQDMFDLPNYESLRGGKVGFLTIRKLVSWLTSSLPIHRRPSECWRIHSRSA